MRCLLRAAEALAGRRRVRLLLLLLRQVLVRLLQVLLVRVRRELLAQALGADRLALLGLGLLALLERPLELHLPATARREEEQDAERPRRRQHRACWVPSSWWRTKRTLNGRQTILHPSIGVERGIVCRPPSSNF